VSPGNYEPKENREKANVLSCPKTHPAAP